MRMMKTDRILLKACLASLMALACTFPAHPTSAAETKVVTLKVRGDARQRILILRPDGPPKASVVLYAGSAGNIKLKADGTIEAPGNFLVRSRAHFAAEGFLVAVVDRPSDWAGSDAERYRMTTAHVEDAAAIAGVMRQEAPVPIWFVGTSRGTISVANIASRLGGDKIAGIVLTSSVTNPGKKAQQAVTDADLAGIAVPVLILGHGADDCYVTPWSEQEALAKRFKNAAAVEAVRIDGGDQGNLHDACGPFSHHGFLGQEKEVVARIAAWIRGHQR
jgi:pimeloyl-ACP methyl ester carboxylesterase